ncbi:regulatory protein RecX [Desulfoluna butyratoxydans]|uniref:Regulatory protein RecX n=1 Tax=Desulfoluna butyratoxydans TaxID=231438 RepID=A0A4U8YMW0_9BACT|nr:regulatory protein RecX [Desulfoluna butyratoxydans]VFQ42543.1 regulatory protein recx [Desulfoluna butyratoxydans]
MSDPFPWDDENAPEASPKRPQKITDIDYSEKRPGKADIFLNGKKAFSMNAFDAALLERGSVMDPAEVEKRAFEDEKQRCWASTLRLLGVRSRSRAELMRRLREKKFSKKAAELSLDRAEKAGFINDEAFAREWIDSRLRNQPKGRYLLKQELRLKGVDEALVDRLLEEGLDETAAALTLLRKKAWKWKKAEPPVFKQKAYTFLAGKGFTFDITREAVDRFLREKEEEEQD